MYKQHISHIVFFSATRKPRITLLSIDFIYFIVVITLKKENETIHYIITYYSAENIELDRSV